MRTNINRLGHTHTYTKERNLQYIIDQASNSIHNYIK